MTTRPHDDPRLAAVLAAAAAPAEDPLPGEAAALTAFRDVHGSSRRTLMSRFGLHRSDSAKMLAAAIFGGAVMVTGAAGAATGTLPLGHSSHSHHATTKAETDDPNDAGGNGHGAEVSQLAHTTDLTGVDKGRAICTLASHGKCKAGQHGKAAAAHKHAKNKHRQDANHRHTPDAG